MSRARRPQRARALLDALGDSRPGVVPRWAPSKCCTATTIEPTTRVMPSAMLPSLPVVASVRTSAWSRQSRLGRARSSSYPETTAPASFAEPHVKAAPRKAVIFVTATMGLSLGLGVTPVTLLLVAAVAGLAWPVPRPKKAAPEAA